MYKRIVLATDGSVHSLRAAKHAIYLANFNVDSRVEIINVIDPTRAKSELLNNWNTDELENNRKKRIIEVEKIANEAGVSFVINMLAGDPGPTIVEYVNKIKPDIVVIGSRGLNGIKEFVLGSVSHKVAKSANCPVLIIK